ncbi:sugar phosphate isomerase/epimerase family protein [Paenibacillus sp. JDR-2]|uniref:sugar phosphate isomerase/epimerase family protein n=1 Tax=Paenibacillus sp. (strain JDR-2) TaxID=324057 RepID=UPI000673D4C0|nr:sugar phosphate isomerase/epimerase [Paenibacillus sp. JDR-2]
MRNQGMEYGALCHEFEGISIEETAERMREIGFTIVQLDPRAANVSLGEVLPSPERAQQVRRIFEAQGIRIAALAGYSNLMDCNPSNREKVLEVFEGMIALCEHFGTPYIATETGGLDPINPWANSPLNHTEEAWNELVPILRRLQSKAAMHNAVILLEGYVNNVLSTTDKAKRIIEELGMNGLGFVLDPFNYLNPEDFDDQRQAFERVFEAIGAYSPIAHAKDAVWIDEWLVTPRVGTGVAEWPIYAELLRQHKPDIPLLLEHMKLEEAQESLRFVQAALQIN